jgi:hypothetical protein
VLKVWVKQDPRIDPSARVIADYITVLVDDVISPEVKTVVVGDVICFSSELLTAGDAIGAWGVGERNAGSLQVNPSGLGVASKPGTSSIHYYVGASQYTLADIHVAPVGGVSLTVATGASPLTNAGSTSASVGVTLFPDGGTPAPNLKGSLTSGCSEALSSASISTPFTCEISLGSNAALAKELFSVTAAFDVSSGGYTCVITSKVLTSDSILELASRIDYDLQVSASVSRASGDVITSNTVSILYFAPFHVLTSVEEPILLATDATAPTEILVSTTPSVAPHLDVVAAHPSVISIEKMVEVINLTKEPLKILVSIQNAALVEKDILSHIDIQNTITGENIT